jgi:hypothetical protein
MTWLFVGGLEGRFNRKPIRPFFVAALPVERRVGE